MIKEIIKDEFFLKQKSKECTKEDTYIAQELLETIQALICKIIKCRARFAVSFDAARNIGYPGFGYYPVRLFRLGNVICHARRH